jgi:hypothetical protein
MEKQTVSLLFETESIFLGATRRHHWRDHRTPSTNRSHEQRASSGDEEVQGAHSTIREEDLFALKGQ